MATAARPGNDTKRPPSQGLSISSMVRLKALGRLRRRKRIAGPEIHDPWQIAVLEELARNRDQGVGRGVEAEFQIQQWIASNGPRKAAVLANLPDDLEKIRTLVEQYLRIDDGSSLFFRNPINDTLEAVSNTAQWNRALDIWRRTEGPRTLGRLNHYLADIVQILRWSPAMSQRRESIVPVASPIGMQSTLLRRVGLDGTGDTSASSSAPATGRDGLASEGRYRSSPISFSVPATPATAERPADEDDPTPTPGWPLSPTPPGSEPATPAASRGVNATPTPTPTPGATGRKFFPDTTDTPPLQQQLATGHPEEGHRQLLPSPLADTGSTSMSTDRSLGSRPMDSAQATARSDRIPGRPNIAGWLKRWETRMEAEQGVIPMTLMYADTLIRMILDTWLTMDVANYQPPLPTVMLVRRPVNGGAIDSIAQAATGDQRMTGGLYISSVTRLRLLLSQPEVCTELQPETIMNLMDVMLIPLGMGVHATRDKCLTLEGPQRVQCCTVISECLMLMCYQPMKLQVPHMEQIGLYLTGCCAMPEHVVQPLLIGIYKLTAQTPVPVTYTPIPQALIAQLALLTPATHPRTVTVLMAALSRLADHPASAEQLFVLGVLPAMSVVLPLLLQDTCIMWTFRMVYTIILYVHSRTKDSAAIAKAQISHVLPAAIGVMQRFTNEPALRVLALRLCHILSPEACADGGVLDGTRDAWKDVPCIEQLAVNAFNNADSAKDVPLHEYALCILAAATQASSTRLRLGTVTRCVLVCLEYLRKWAAIAETRARGKSKSGTSSHSPTITGAVAACVCLAELAQVSKYQLAIWSEGMLLISELRHVLVGSTDDLERLLAAWADVLVQRALQHPVNAANAFGSLATAQPAGPPPSKPQLGTPPIVQPPKVARVMWPPPVPPPVLPLAVPAAPVEPVESDTVALLGVDEAQLEATAAASETEQESEQASEASESDVSVAEEDQDVAVQHDEYADILTLDPDASFVDEPVDGDEGFVMDQTAAEGDADTEPHAQPDPQNRPASESKSLSHLDSFAHFRNADPEADQQAGPDQSRLFLSWQAGSKQAKHAVWATQLEAAMAKLHDFACCPLVHPLIASMTLGPLLRFCELSVASSATQPHLANGLSILWCLTSTPEMCKKMLNAHVHIHLLQIWKRRLRPAVTATPCDASHESRCVSQACMNWVGTWNALQAAAPELLLDPEDPQGHVSAAVGALMSIARRGASDGFHDGVALVRAALVAILRAAMMCKSGTVLNTVAKVGASGVHHATPWIVQTCTEDVTASWAWMALHAALACTQRWGPLGSPGLWPAALTLCRDIVGGGNSPRKVPIPVHASAGMLQTVCSILGAQLTCSSGGFGFPVASADSDVLIAGMDSISMLLRLLACPRWQVSTAAAAWITTSLDRLVYDRHSEPHQVANHVGYVASDAARVVVQAALDDGVIHLLLVAVTRWLDRPVIVRRCLLGLAVVLPFCDAEAHLSQPVTRRLFSAMQDVWKAKAAHASETAAHDAHRLMSHIMWSLATHAVPFGPKDIALLAALLTHVTAYTPALSLLGLAVWKVSMSPPQLVELGTTNVLEHSVQLVKYFCENPFNEARVHQEKCLLSAVWNCARHPPHALYMLHSGGTKPLVAFFLRDVQLPHTESVDSLSRLTLQALVTIVIGVHAGSPTRMNSVKLQILKGGILRPLADVIRADGASTGLRMAAIRLYHLLTPEMLQSESERVMPELRAAWMGKDSMEQLAVELLSPGQPEALQRFGTQVASAATNVASTRRRLAKAGGVKVLVNALIRRWTACVYSRSMATSTIMEDAAVTMDVTAVCNALDALVNMSLEHASQPEICARTLSTMVHILESGAPDGVKSRTSMFLLNLARHRENRTRLLKANLSRFAPMASTITGQEPVLPHLHKHDADIFTLHETSEGTDEFSTTFLTAGGDHENGDSVMTHGNRKARSVLTLESAGDATVEWDAATRSSAGVLGTPSAERTGRSLTRDKHRGMSPAHSRSGSHSRSRSPVQSKLGLTETASAFALRSVASQESWQFHKALRASRSQQYDVASDVRLRPVSRGGRGTNTVPFTTSGSFGGMLPPPLPSIGSQTERPPSPSLVLGDEWWSREELPVMAAHGWEPDIESIKAASYHHEADRLLQLRSVAQRQWAPELSMVTLQEPLEADARPGHRLTLAPGTAKRHEFAFGGSEFVQTPDYKPPPLPLPVKQTSRDKSVLTLAISASTPVLKNGPPSKLSPFYALLPKSQTAALAVSSTAAAHTATKSSEPETADPLLLAASKSRQYRRMSTSVRPLLPAVMRSSEALAKMGETFSDLRQRDRDKLESRMQKRKKPRARDIMDWDWDKNWDWDWVTDRWRITTDGKSIPDPHPVHVDDDGNVTELPPPPPPATPAGATTQGQQQAGPPRTAGSTASRRTPMSTARLMPRPRGVGRGVGQMRSFAAEGQPTVALAEFLHVDGCKVCYGLYGHYKLPDGRTVHYHVTDRLHERGPQEHPLEREGASSHEDIGVFEWPEIPEPPVIGTDVLPRWELPEVGVPPGVHGPMPVLLPKQAPQFIVVRRQFKLDPKALEKHLKAGAANLKKTKKKSQSKRKLVKPARKRSSVELVALLEGAHLPEWARAAPAEFVFAPRVLESGGMDIYDNEALMDSAFEADWNRLNLKTSFIAMLRDACDGDSRMVDDIRMLLRAHIRLLYDVYDFYCVFSAAADGFSLLLAAFYEFCVRTMLLRPNTAAYVTAQATKLGRAEVQKAFTLSVMAGGTSGEKSLSRAEFVEACLRISFMKYRLGGTSAFRAADLFILDHLKRYCGPDVAHGRNQFRYEVLYVKEINDVLAQHTKFISRLYTHVVSVYTSDSSVGTHTGGVSGAATFAVRMTLTAFIAMLAGAKLFDGTFTIREARLAFTYSRMRTVEDTQYRTEATTLTLTDFYEALVRVSTMRWLPTDEDLEAFGCETAYEYLSRHYDSVGRRRSTLRLDPNMGVPMMNRDDEVEDPPAPVYDKLTKLIQVLQGEYGAVIESAGAVAGDNRSTSVGLLKAAFRKVRLVSKIAVAAGGAASPTPAK